MLCFAGCCVTGSSASQSGAEDGGEREDGPAWRSSSSSLVQGVRRVRCCDN